MSRETNRMIMFAARIPAPMRGEIDAATARRARRSPGFTQSDAVREALRAWLDDHAPVGDAQQANQ